MGAMGCTISEMTSIIQLASSQIAEIDGRLTELSRDMQQLSRVKDAWTVILSAEQERTEEERSEYYGAREMVNEMQSAAAQAESDLLENQNEAKLEGIAAYGDKTQAMRRLLVEAQSIGLTRFQIVKEAKNLGTHPNFPYRFIARMLEGMELIESDGRFIATEKMREKLRPVAA